MMRMVIVKKVMMKSGSTEDSATHEENNTMEFQGNEADENNKEDTIRRPSVSPKGNYVTRYGRETRPVERYGDLAAMALTQAEFGYQANLREIAMIEFELAGVGAGLGGGLKNTRQLKPMKYDKAMATVKEGGTKVVEEEHERMIKNNVCVPTE